MSPPDRSSAGGRAYLDLRARARREGRPTDELLVLYILERFLYRLSISEHRSRLVLKGGMLLAAFDERRPTADIDLLANAIANEVESIAGVVRTVLAVDVGDGVTFEAASLRAHLIREADPYAGVRITVPARLDQARHPLRIDVSVGDPVTPGPVEVTYPALLDEPFHLVGYPLETVLAEKVVTMIDRGDANTRPGLRRRLPADRTPRSRCRTGRSRHPHHRDVPRLRSPSAPIGAHRPGFAAAGRLDALPGLQRARSPVAGDSRRDHWSGR